MYLPLAAQLNTGCLRHGFHVLLLAISVITACLALCMDILPPCMTSVMANIAAFAASKDTHVTSFISAYVSDMFDAFDLLHSQPFNCNTM